MVGGKGMKKKALRKSTMREIFASKARFFSILLIILLGVCFYAGIKATGPDMVNTADTYYKEQQLMETKVVSPLGITEDDIKAARQSKGIDIVEPSYSLDVTQSNSQRVVKLMSYNQENKESLNQPVVIEGHLPKKEGEIAMDYRSKELNDVEIGETLTFDVDTDEEVSRASYKVVGFVNSPLFIDRVSRGNTMVGKGTVDYFGLIPETNFLLDRFTELYVTYASMTEQVAYGPSYEKAYTEYEKNLKDQLKDRPEEEIAKIKKEGEKEIDKGRQELNKSSNQLKEGEAELRLARQHLDDQKNQLEQGKALGMPVSKEQEQAVEEAENTLLTEEKKLEDSKETLEKAETELQDKERELSELSAPEYLYFSRHDNPSFSEFEDNADRISSIATVFPVFFFLIAALICLTTMTRMVDEKRGEIGTLKALGYTNWEVAQKFIVYSTLASVIGTGLGLVIGFNLFPTVIFDAYRNLYNLPPVIVTYYASYTIQSIVVALLCTLLSSLIVLRVDLLSTPAVLMRPKAPKPGKRIFLERLPKVWSRFNFNQKVTARNLFRYKQRMLMTILGIAGCMAMILTGFGLKDSIGDIVTKQFSDIWHYDASVYLDRDDMEQSIETYEAKRDGIPEVSEHLMMSQKTVDVVKKGMTSQEVIIDIPKESKELTKFITFKDRVSGEGYELDDTGVIINEKLSRLLEIKVGDTLSIKDADNQEHQVRVSQIVENYAMHFMYMTPTYYETIFKESPVFNVDYLLFNKELSNKEEEQLSKKLMEEEEVMTVSYTSKIGEAMDDTMESLNIVVWVLIVSAAMLAFVVLYNLTNINISERIRELSTIKVLGFYDKEVTMYVYRENNILTVLGILLGFVLGRLLHGFVLTTAEVDMMMFPKDIHLVSYLYSTLLTVLFSTIVMLVMHRKLRKVDMIEALKSTE